MVRALIVAAALAVLASACSGGGTMCGDLCVPGKTGECDAPYTCVSPGRCLVVSDAGPSACN